MDEYPFESELLQAVMSGEKTVLDYVMFSSEDIRHDFYDFCSEHGLRTDERSAKLFLDSIDADIAVFAAN